MIHIFYTVFDKPISASNWSSFLKYLPFDIIERTKKYRRWEDQHAFLLGRLLLIEAFRKNGLDEKKILDIKFNEFGKPFLNNNFNFNISHSGQFVVCAVSQNIVLGIDIETIQKVDFKDYKHTMTDTQWEKIENSQNPLKSFFRFWTIKESVLKAEEKGLSIPLSEINITDDIAFCKKSLWYLTELDIDKEVCLTIASDKQNPILFFFKVDFSDGVTGIKTVKTKLKKLKRK